MTTLTPSEWPWSTTAQAVKAIRTLAKARNLTDLNAAAHWLPDGSGAEGRLPLRIVLLQQAVEQINDAELRQAARILFPLPYLGSAPSLTRRRQQAAEVFFVSASAFRSGTTARPSREDRVFAAIDAQLAIIVGASDLDETPQAAVVPTVDLQSSGRPLKLSRRALSAGAVAAAVVLVALPILAGRGGRASVTTAEVASGRGDRVSSDSADGEVVRTRHDIPDHTVRTPRLDRPPPTSESGERAFIPGRSISPVSIELTAATPRRSTDDDRVLTTTSIGSTIPIPAGKNFVPHSQQTTAPAPTSRSLTPSSGATTSGSKAAPTDPAAESNRSEPTVPKKRPAPPDTTSTTTSSSTTTTSIARTTPPPNAEPPPVAEPPPASQNCPGKSYVVDTERLQRVAALLVDLGRPHDVCQASQPIPREDMTAVKFQVYGDTTSWIDVRLADGRSIVVPHGAWSSYSDLVERFGGLPDVGHPSVWRLLPDGSSELVTTAGLIVVGGVTDIIHFSVAPPFLDRWLDNRELLGAPMRAAHQTEAEFEHGRMDLTDGTVQVTHVAPADARAVLPPDGDLVNSIIRQPNRTAWWVDDQLRRWWIPSGGTWNCLGGHDALSANNLDGAVVASLPIAGRATCELKDG